MEEVIIAEKKYYFTNNLREKANLRHSFSRLSEKTFDGLSFESWYQAGYWGDGYIPYALVEGGEGRCQCVCQSDRF